MKIELLLALSEQKGFDKPINLNSDDDYNNEESIQEEDEEEKEVVEATSLTDESVHGGNEATDSVEDSPSCSETGKKEKELSDGSNDSVDKTSDKTSTGSNPLSKSTPERDAISKSISDFLILSLKTVDEIVAKVKEIAKIEKGNLKSNLSQSWDSKKIAKHLSTDELHKILTDRKPNREANKCYIFLDLSGSFAGMYENLKKAIKEISACGFEVTVMDCGNGFNYEKSVLKGEYDTFNSRERLEKIIKGTKATVHPVYTTPSIDDAIKLVNEAEFSIIIADYDGFSSFSKVSYGCEYEKIPYFFDFENRYEYPEEHDWVDEEWSDYADKKKWIPFNYYFGTPAWECEEEEYY